MRCLGSTRDPRVLHVVTTMEDGAGMMRSVTELAIQTAQAGADVEIVGPLPPGKQPWVLGPGEAAWVKSVVIPQPLRLSSHTAVFLGVRNAVRQLAAKSCAAPRVVHVHGVWMPANIAAWSACRHWGVGYVISPHGMLLPQAMAKNPWRKHVMARCILRSAFGEAAAVHVTSSAEADAVAAVNPAAKITLLPWGCENPRAGSRRMHDDSTQVAGYLGRLLPIKGLNELLDAWAAVRPQGWRLRLAGPDPEGFGESLRARIGRLGVEDSVTIEPPIVSDRTSQWLEALDLLILPSRSENFGLVVSEALALGCPVITTTATPWGDVVSHRCGWSVPASADSLSAAIGEATRLSAGELREMGARGRRWITDTLAWPTLVPRYWSELYRFTSPQGPIPAPCR